MKREGERERESKKVVGDIPL